MRIERHFPTDILKPFIKTFMIIESEDGMVNRILPDTSIVVAFRYKGTTFAGADGKIRLPASAVSGLTKSARFLAYSKETATLLVRFNEGGARAFSDEPLHELSGLHVSLDNLVQRRKLVEIEEQLAAAKNNSQRFSIVERFMLSELKRPRSDQLILDAVQKIKFANGDLRIKDLLTNLSISQDPFEKRFRQAIGTSPKQFAKVVRLRNLIGNYSQTKNLTDAAFTAGYYDQPHFIRDFKSFTGQTPKDFFKSPSFM
jgi:methylphosphotriester-DNA--protein-cysteine methyltransferase